MCFLTYFACMSQPNIDFNKCMEAVFSLFPKLKEEEKEKLRQHTTFTYCKKGEMLYQEGEKPTGMICLIKGKVKVFKEGVGGRDQIVRMAKPVGLIGYRALFAEEKHIASAQTIENSIIGTVSKAGLFEVLHANVDLTLDILKSLATELGFSNSRTVTLTQKHIRGRLAESLIFLKDTYGLESDEKTLKIYLLREDLANLSNMTTSNAIRTLSNFSEENIIALDGRKIKILDLARLEKISERG